VKYVLKLFVTEASWNGRTAISNLKKIVKELPVDNEYDIQIIDIVKDPAAAFNEKIIIVPTLIRTHPPPSRKVFGNLSDGEKVILGLSLT
jgi:circadian clock protein KaiB